MKYLCKYVLLCLGLLLITFSCQKETLIEDTSSSLNEDGINNDLFKKRKLSDFEHVKDYVAEIKAKSNLKNNSNRSAFETSNDFIILEHQDMAIHSGDEFNTYTIPVLKTQQAEGTFSNLVVQFSVASDSTSAYLLTYQPNLGYLEAYATNDQTPFSGQVTYESLDYDGSLDGLNARMVCHNIHVTYCNWGGETHAAGEGCTASFMWTETYNICYESNDGFGSGSETIEPPEGPRGGGTSGTTNTPNTGSSTSTIPADVVSEVTSILNLNELNDQATISWLNDPENFTEVINIFLFLEEHTDPQGNANQEALDFVEIVIESLIEQRFNFNELVHLYNNLDKKCQAQKIIEFISNTDSPIVNFVSNVFSGDENYNFSMEDVDLPIQLDANANTIFPSGLNFNSESAVIIQFDNGYLDNATDLSIVMTAAHEFVHAYLAYLYSDGQLLIAYPQYTDLNSAFSVFQSNPNQTTGELLAEAMHDVYDDFLDWISQSVFTYATNNNIENVTQEYCNKLVIGAHEHTDAYQTLSEENKNAYSIIAVNEQNGTEQAKGTNCE